MSYPSFVRNVSTKKRRGIYKNLKSWSTWNDPMLGTRKKTTTSKGSEWLANKGMIASIGRDVGGRCLIPEGF